jgi:NAD(P)-dependent dehydrogenase (short-subunit alcohol dehydrogenase family)
MKGLGGRTAVVTGAASGIGLALARRLAIEGMAVVLADLPGERLHQAVAGLSGDGLAVNAEPVDVSDPKSCDALAAATRDRYGGVDVVCLNAGVLGPTNVPLWEIDDADWRAVLDVNLFGVINGIRSFVPGLLTRPESHVAVTASLAGLVTGDGEGPYVASKHAVVAIAEILHRQLSGTAVGVSVLCPWWVKTDILASTKNRGTVDGLPLAEHQRLRDSGLDPDEFAETVLHAIRADRFYVHTHPELVTEAVSERARQILSFD